ncbi:uncharacterized protein LOC133128208 [Conger conger]|uniref:uncharacterized protein LOC133128208 n=1 Tax=Conger conger TaxID=82655 RepID=UPI002A5A5A23|nr:uncharacterized protein LOC133128208 [Conger conger]
MGAPPQTPLCEKRQAGDPARFGGEPADACALIFRFLPLSLPPPAVGHLSLRAEAAGLPSVRLSVRPSGPIRSGLIRSVRPVLGGLPGPAGDGSYLSPSLERGWGPLSSAGDVAEGDPGLPTRRGQMSNSVDSPGELSFVSEHDTFSDSSDTSARRQRQRKEKEKKKKKKMRKKSERGVASHSPCETAADPMLPSSPCERKTPKVAERPATGQTNGAFEPDTD